MTVPRLVKLAATSAALATTGLSVAASTASATPNSGVLLTSPTCNGYIQRGQSGPCVARLQTLLNSRAHANLPVVGVFGPYTQRAVQSWQASHALSAKGIVGPLTKKSLEQGSPATLHTVTTTSVKKPTTATTTTHTTTATGLPTPTGSTNTRVMKTVTAVMAGTLYPYVWGGGHGPNPGPQDSGGMDCSGFTRWVYAQALGYDVFGGTTAAGQQSMTNPVTSPIPGDLVFFTSNGNTHHVAIYTGNGGLVEEPHTGQSMKYSTVAWTTGQTDIVTYGRLR